MANTAESKPITYIRDGRAPLPLRESTSRVMRANKSKNTKPEIRFRKLLYTMGGRGYRIHKKGILGKPDIVFTKKRIAIFINGCFWHRCPYCNPSIPKSHFDFWQEKFTKNVNRDKIIEEELIAQGWKVYIIWECQINNESFLTKIISEILWS
jgi:DNA mismatch endonuclease, patch repair protein